MSECEDFMGPVSTGHDLDKQGRCRRCGERPESSGDERRERYAETWKGKAACLEAENKRLLAELGRSQADEVEHRIEAGRLRAELEGVQGSRDIAHQRVSLWIRRYGALEATIARLRTELESLREQQKSTSWELTDAYVARRETEVDCAKRIRAANATLAHVRSVLDDFCRSDDAYSGIAAQIRAALNKKEDLMEENVEVTLSYVNGEGDDVAYAKTLTPEGLAAVIVAMDDGEAGED